MTKANYVHTFTLDEAQEKELQTLKSKGITIKSIVIRGIKEATKKENGK